MKHNIIFSLSLIGLASVFYCCTTEPVNTVIQDQDDLDKAIFEQLSFLSAMDMIGQTAFDTRSAEEDDLDSDEEFYSEGVIVAYDPYKKKTRCHSGVGICNVEWFPSNAVSNTRSDIMRMSSVLCINKNQDTYFDIILSSPVSAELENQLPSIMVEEDVIGYSNVPGCNGFVVVQGEYSFNRSLGQFGGYRIFVDHEN